MKLAFAIGYDLFDFTIGRFLFFVPGASELFGGAVACLLFGPRGLFYLLEIVDPTEQLDGFIPTMTLIALAVRREEEAAATARNVTPSAIAGRISQGE